MATYNPEPRLFRRQIESIVNQSHRNWVCVISDDASSPAAQQEMNSVIQPDPRFQFYPSPERAGFYHNFERALTLAPETSQFIALCDQDDYWYPEKLATLLAHFNDQTMLVYSDMRIVDGENNQIAPSFWTHKRNNYTDFGSLLLANTVTGAASLFRRELLKVALPFPARAGLLAHDHWIACVAMANGNLAYVNRPLYDYVQHSSNIIGYSAKVAERCESLPRFIYDMFRWLRTEEGEKLARQAYLDQAVKVITMAREILSRARSGIARAKKRTLKNAARLDMSLFAWLWLATKGLKEWRVSGTTAGIELSMLLLLRRHDR